MSNNQNEDTEHKNFSIIVPKSVYLKLRLLAAHKDMSLGALCRQYLSEASTRDAKALQIRKSF